MCSEDELSLCHRGDGNKQMFEGDDLFRRDDVITDIEAFNLTFFERVSELFDVIHYNQVIANV